MEQSKNIDTFDMYQCRIWKKYDQLCHGYDHLIIYFGENSWMFMHHSLLVNTLLKCRIPGLVFFLATVPHKKESLNNIFIFLIFFNDFQNGVKFTSLNIQWLNILTFFVSIVCNHTRVSYVDYCVVLLANYQTLAYQIWVTFEKIIEIHKNYIYKASNFFTSGSWPS